LIKWIHVFLYNYVILKKKNLIQTYVQLIITKAFLILTYEKKSFDNTKFMIALLATLKKQCNDHNDDVQIGTMNILVY